MKSNSSKNTITIILAIVIIASGLLEWMVYCEIAIFPLFEIESSYLNSAHIAMFSGIIVLAIFGGTVLSYTSNACISMYGINKNEIMLSAIKLYYGINMKSIIYSILWIMLISIITLYLQFYNAMVILFLSSVILAILEITLSINIIQDSNTSDDLEKYCNDKLKKTIKLENMQDFYNYIVTILSTIKEDYVTGGLRYKKEIIFMYSLKTSFEERLNFDESKLQEFNNNFYTTIDNNIYNYLNNFENGKDIDYIEQILFIPSDKPKLSKTLYLYTLDSLVNKSSHNSLKAFDLVESWFNKFVIKRDDKYHISEHTYIGYLIKIYRLCASEKEKYLLENKFIELCDSMEIKKSYLPFYFVIKNYTETSNQRLSEILRRFIVGYIVNKNTLGIDVAIYFNYINQSNVISSQIKDTLKLALNDTLYNCMSFQKFVTTQIKMVGIHNNNILQSLEYSDHIVNWTVYRNELNSNFVAQNKIYFSILLNIEISFENFTHYELLECRAMFDNKGIIKNEYADKLKNIAFLYSIDIAEKYIEAFNRLNSAYWISTKNHVKLLKQEFNKNVLAELLKKISKCESPTTKASFLITNNKHIDSVWESIEKQFNNKLIVNIESVLNQKNVLLKDIFKYNFNNEKIELRTTNDISVIVYSKEAKDYLNDKYLIIEYIT